MEQSDEDEEEYERIDDSTNSSQNLLKHKLKVSNKLSPQFHQFYEAFSDNVDFIIQFEYNILP